MCIYSPLVASLQKQLLNTSPQETEDNKRIQDDQEGYIPPHNESWGGGVKKQKPKEKATQFIKLQIKKKTKQLKSKKIKQLGVSHIATEFITPILA